MLRSFSILLFLGLCLGCASAQTPFVLASTPAEPGLPWLAPAALEGPSSSDIAVTALPLTNGFELPRMAPDLALQAYEKRVEQQNAQLASYSVSTVIHAELPDTSQSGEYELERHYVAPRTLQFKAIRFTGDNFVKTNVIARLLQSEVDHLQKDDLGATALSPVNYKFSYKGTNDIEGRVVHVFQVKPRKKRAGLFKGRIYLDAYTGSLARVEGNVVKSPSFFVKRVDFVQEYSDIDGFTLPTHVHSEARARIVGRAVVDIYQRDYQPVASSTQARQQVPTL